MLNRQTLTLLTWLQKPLSESIRFLAVLWGQPTEKDKEALGCPVLSFNEVTEKGRQNLTGFEANPVRISGSDLATLVYTSGTTGKPKVTAYCHGRFLCCSAQILDHVPAMHVSVCVLRYCTTILPYMNPACPRASLW
jgi:long-subunit acyl-CoA synthetase (AMP-forming)